MSKRNQNSIRLIDQKVDQMMPTADTDTFTNFPFVGIQMPTPVLTMQDIYLHEKGKEALKNLNIKLTHSKKNDPPQFDLPVKEEKKKPEVKPKIKKSLVIEKTPDAESGKDSGRKTRLNITTTILKD